MTERTKREEASVALSYETNYSRFVSTKYTLFFISTFMYKSIHSADKTDI